MALMGLRVERGARGDAHAHTTWHLSPALPDFLAPPRAQSPVKLGGGKAAANVKPPLHGPPQPQQQQKPPPPPQPNGQPPEQLQQPQQLNGPTQPVHVAEAVGA